MTTCFGCMKNLSIMKDTVVVLGRPDTKNCITWCKSCYRNGLYEIQKKQIENYIKQINMLATIKE